MRGGIIKLNNETFGIYRASCPIITFSTHFRSITKYQSQYLSVDSKPKSENLLDLSAMRAQNKFRRFQLIGKLGSHFFHNKQLTQCLNGLETVKTMKAMCKRCKPSSSNCSPHETGLEAHVPQTHKNSWWNLCNLARRQIKIPSITTKLLNICTFQS